MNKPTCEKSVKMGVAKFKDCGMPADSYSEKLGYLCSEHAKLALIAFGDVRPVQPKDYDWQDRLTMGNEE